jgi:hypothetical protein
MSLSGNRSRLAATSRELWARWDETRAHWRDEKSGEFQRRYLEELMIRVEKTVTVIEKLDELLARVRKDCE